MTAYSSTLNLRMKDLYDKNYYTPQLPMRTFRNPYFLPTSNQLLFDILKKQSTTSATATPPTTATPLNPSTASSVPPSTTGPKRPAATAAKPAAAAKPKQTKEEAEIQDAFNKSVARQKAAAAKAAAAAKTTAAPKTKAGGGKIAAKVFSPPPTFIKGETLDSKLSKIKSWKLSQPPLSQVTTTNKQDAD